MATQDMVYNATTAAQEPKSRKWFIVPSENLEKSRFVIKVVEVEVVSNCSECGPLYFFEFVSCTAFLFTLLLLILLATPLHQRVGINSWPTLLLSFVAFVMEEVVSNCSECGPLYFFEFVSCTAFLFTLLLLILLATPLHQRVGINSWPTLDFGYTITMAILFLLASIVFAARNGNTPLEQGAVAFGFLATVAFFIDFGLFMKYRGAPCQKGNNQQADHTPRPESEKLNSNGADSVN